jgi:HSP20 family protein
MSLKNFLPWNWGKREVAVHHEDEGRMLALQTDINRAFDHFWRSFASPMVPWEMGALFEKAMPRMEVSETDREIEISAELPGMSETDLDVSVTKDALKIKGEKKSEREENGKDFYLRERSYGAVQRVIPLPDGLDIESVKATFKNGVLNVSIPKTEEALAQVKRIPVKAA